MTIPNLAVKTGNSAQAVIPSILDGSTGLRMPVHAIGKTPSQFARVPFIEGAFVFQISGSATVGMQNGALPFNGSGSACGVAVDIPLWTPGATVGPGVAMQIPFSGAVFGLCIRNDTSIPPMSIGIDGDHYAMEDYLPYFLNRAQNPISGDLSFLVATDLDPNQQHIANLIFPNTPYGTSSYRLLHMILDKNAGYKDDVLASSLLALTGLTTSFASLPNGSAPNRTRHIEMLEFYNSDVATRIVQIQVGSTVIWNKSIPAGTTAFYPEMGGTVPRAMLNSSAGAITVKADAGAVVNMTTWGKTR